MTFSDYQAQAKTTARYNGRGTVRGLRYVALGLAGEAGEVANKVKKIDRDENDQITKELADAILDELSDVLWYASQIAEELGADLGAVARSNVEKLASRHQRGVISGSGDGR